MASIDEILEGSDTDEPQGETTAEVQETTPAETVELKPAEETEGEPPAPETEKPEGQVPKAALMDERAKRQAAQRQVAELTEKIAAQPVEKPDFWADPEKALDAIQQSTNSQMQNMFLNMSEMNARSRHEDFDVMTQTFFEEMVEDNPALKQQAMNQPDPYEFAYNAAKQHMRMKEVGDLDTFESKVRADERTKIETELREKIESELKNATVPPSLSTARAAGGNTNAPYSAPTMNELFD